MVISLLRSLHDQNPQAKFKGDQGLYKKTPKAPAAPDPVATSAAQTASDKETAWYNAQLANMNQYTPYGSMTYKQVGTKENPQWNSTISLSPEQQKLYDLGAQGDVRLAQLGNEQLGRISDAVSSPYSYAGMGDAPTAQSIEELSQQGQEALLSRLNPQFGYDEEALRTRLINQGIGQGSEAYRREMDTFNQSKNDARMQAVMGGAQYGGTLQDQAMARRNQAINEYTTQRNAPLNEYTAMTSGSQVQNPSFTQQGNTGIPNSQLSNLINQQYQGAMNQYNQKIASNNATTSGLFSLGGQLGAAAFLASDINLKENIVKVGEKKGFNLYQFNYKNDDTKKQYIGVMAQEIQESRPDAVSKVDGYLAVDYGKLGLEMVEV